MTKTQPWFGKRATQSSEGPISFGSNARAFGGDGSFQKENQAGRGQPNKGKDKEGIEVGGDLHEFGKLGRLVSVKQAGALV